MVMLFSQGGQPSELNYAHSTFLATMRDGGLVGLALLCLVYFLAFKTALRIALAHGRGCTGPTFDREAEREPSGEHGGEHGGERTAALTCPEGHGPLTPKPHPRDAEVTVDVCESCGGLFLDPGELEAFRQAEPPPGFVRQYANEAADGVGRAALDLVFRGLFSLLDGI